MNPKTQKNPRYRNGPPKVVDQTPQESLLDLLSPGRPGFSEFPLEDRSDRLGGPPPTVFPAGEVTLHPTPVRGPGPSGTTPRGWDDALDTRLLPKPSMGRHRSTGAGWLPGPKAEATETGSRGRPEPPGPRWPGAGPPRPSTTSGTASPADDAPCASRSRGGPGAGKSPSPPAGNASGTAAGSSPGPPSTTGGHPMPHEPVERPTPSPRAALSSAELAHKSSSPR